MIELLKNIALVWKAMFIDWFPKIANADLGTWGKISSAIAIIGIAIKLIKKNVD